MCCVFFKTTIKTTKTSSLIDKYKGKKTPISQPGRGGANTCLTPLLSGPCWGSFPPAALLPFLLQRSCVVWNLLPKWCVLREGDLPWQGVIYWDKEFATVSFLPLDVVLGMGPVLHKSLLVGYFVSSRQKLPPHLPVGDCTLQSRCEKKQQRRVLPSGQNFSSSPGRSFSPGGGGRWLEVLVDISSWALADGLAGAQGLGGIRIGKRMTRRPGEQV